ncbi:MAG: serine/threonine protein kinase [Lachnospiraceae bacterium]
MQEINTWPGWECVRQLGAGSYGKVFEIRKEEAGVTYTAALKVISIPGSQNEIDTGYDEGWYSDEQSATAYFQNQVAEMTKEFALMSSLKGYTNIVSYEDHMIMERKDTMGWDILIRMELLTPLPAYVREHPLTEDKVIQMGCDICSALEVCQKQPQPILHRDIKQANIMVNHTGDFKLGDFGIARTMEGTNSAHSTKGTYDYMAPEVYFGRGYGIQADIYSLGMVLYRQLNNNRNPFLPTEGAISASMQEEARNKRLDGNPVPEPLYGNPLLKTAVLTAIHPDPARRFQTPMAFRKALERARDYKSGGNSVPFIQNTVPMGTGARTQSQTGAPSMPGTGGTAPGYNQNGEPPKKKNKAVLIVIIVLVIIGLLMIAVIALAVTSGKKTKESEKTTSKETVEETTEEPEEEETEEPVAVEEPEEDTTKEPETEKPSDTAEQVSREELLNQEADYNAFLEMCYVDGDYWSNWTDAGMLFKFALGSVESEEDESGKSYYVMDDGSYGVVLQNDDFDPVYSFVDGDGTTFSWVWTTEDNQNVTYFGIYKSDDVGTAGGCFEYTKLLGRPLSSFMEKYVPGKTAYFGDADFVDFSNGYYYFPSYYDEEYDGELYMYLVDVNESEDMEISICYTGKTLQDACISEILITRTKW